jgi:hypothetical protein
MIFRPATPRKGEGHGAKIMLGWLELRIDLGEFPKLRNGKKLSNGWGTPYT